MKTITKTIINAPAELVFIWLEDNDRLKLWVPNIVEDEALLETPEKVGSKFRQVYLERGKEMEMFGEITEYVENKRMRVDISGEMFDLDVAYDLHPLGDAQTELTQHTLIKFKGGMKIFAPLFSLLTKFSSDKSQDESHRKLKQKVEEEFTAQS